jgi:hypothetical protein
MMRALACDPSARLDLIPVDDTAERIVRSLVDDNAPFAIRHATVGAARSATVRWHWFDAQRYYQKHPVLFRPRSVFIGPDGLAFRFADLLAHELPARIAGLGSPAARRQAARVRERISRLNRDFAYFTTRTFEFESTWPMDSTFSAEAFHETVLVGVRNHLLSGIVAPGQHRAAFPRAQ